MGTVGPRHLLGGLLEVAQCLGWNYLQVSSQRPLHMAVPYQLASKSEAEA